MAYIRLEHTSHVRLVPSPAVIRPRLLPTAPSQHQLFGHLNRMRLHGILSRRRSGRQVFYRISDPHVLEILRWVQKRRFADPTFSDGEAI